MNFLAHIFLSGSNTNIQFGNFIADKIKGDEYKKYPNDIKRGILLHREIDFFTDTHHIVKESKKILTPKYGKFSGIIVDMFYDYFLSKNWNNYSDEDLSIFCNNFYQTLKKNSELLPEKIKSHYKIIINENWLMKYSNMKDLYTILLRMDSRLSNTSNNIGDSISILEEREVEFENHFNIFWKDIVNHTDKLLEKW